MCVYVCSYVSVCVYVLVSVCVGGEGGVSLCVYVHVLD